MTPAINTHEHAAALEAEAMDLKEAGLEIIRRICRMDVLHIGLLDAGSTLLAEATEKRRLARIIRERLE